MTGAETSRRLALAEDGVESLFGAHDQNLKRIEHALGVEISARGTEVGIRGEQARVELTANLLEQLSQLAVGGFRFRPKTSAPRCG